MIRTTCWWRLIFVLVMALPSTRALFFGTLGMHCGCGCCGTPSCCGMTTLPSISNCGNNGGVGDGVGCSLTGSGAGCVPGSNNNCQTSSTFGGCRSGNGLFMPLGCGARQPFIRPQSTYVIPTLSTSPFNNLVPQLQPSPLPLAGNFYSNAPMENSSGNGFSPGFQSYTSALPYTTSSSPLIPRSDNYADNVDKTLNGNQITGLGSSMDKLLKPMNMNLNTDLYEDKGPEVDDYGDLTTNLANKGDAKPDLLAPDYSDNSFAKTKGVPNDIGNTADQDTIDDPKCSSETLRVVMQENIVSSPTISKQLIFSAGRLAFGQTIDVICSRNKFSYTVVSSKIFCEASQGRITCFAFLQP